MKFLRYMFNKKYREKYSKNFVEIYDDSVVENEKVYSSEKK